MKSARVIVPCVVSYLHCFEPYSFNKTVPGKYMATLIITK